MANVIRYGSAKLFASDSSSPGTLRSFSLVSELNFGFTSNLQKVASLGSTEVVRKEVGPPSVDIKFSYLLSDLENSERLGIPVTADESVNSGESLLNNIQPIDLAFVTDEQSRDIDSMSDSKRQELKVYVIKNAYLTGYSISLRPRGAPVVNVTLSGEDILFKIFKNLSDYTSFSFQEDTNVVNKLDLNFSETGIGGSKIVSTINRFDFNMSLDYKVLKDFGQYYHKKKLNLPVGASISIGATTNEFTEGELRNTFCKENLNKFIIIYSRIDCATGQIEEKFGMVFKDALLSHQDYAMAVGANLQTSLRFDLNLTKKSGAFFVQQSYSGEEISAESGLGGILVEDGSGGVILTEAITNMLLSLENV
jgi:hypothetical protein